jgi:hypothetical protein
MKNGYELYSSQRKFVEKEIRDSGFITRNFCLRHFISRLSSIVCDINKNGYIIEGERIPVKTIWGTGFDYRYTIKVKPKNSIYV